jgi:D-alanyl-lipoteichoic acid acyltransferase DltB (MBOAT superfamily)
MADYSDRPPPALLPSVITTLVHASVWAVTIAFLVSLVDGPLHRFDDFQMKSPWLTETVFQFALLIRDYLPVVIGVLAVFFIADAAILHALSRTEGRRIGREVWSGLIIALAFAGMYVTATAAYLPLVKITDKLGR